MFNVPEMYSKVQPIEPKQFIQSSMKKADKDRIKENMLEVKLLWQIAGEAIPSFANQRYNCPVIQGLDVRLKTLRKVTYFAELVQHMMKAPCVVRFYDHNSQIYSFAHKRLNQTDSSQVVIEHRLETIQMPIALPDKTKAKLKQYLAFDALLNKADKLGLYMEAMVKGFIVCHPKLYNGIEGLLDRKNWYNKDEVIVLLGKLMELVRLNGEFKTEKLPVNKVKIATKLTSIMEGIKDGQQTTTRNI